MTEKEAIVNPHWLPNVEKCMPCEIRYDYIGRFETLEDDAKYILHSIGANLTFPSGSGSAPTNSSNDNKLFRAYQSVPPNLKERLYEIYKLDFQIFGYDYSKYSISEYV